MVGLSTCARDFCPTPSTVKILHILGGRPHVLLPLKSILAQYLDPGTLCRPCSLFSICEACLKISLYQFNTTNTFNQSRLSRLPRLSTNTSSQYKVRNRIFMIEFQKDWCWQSWSSCLSIKPSPPPPSQYTDGAFCCPCKQFPTFGARLKTT